ncbi:putative Uroporphyrin-III C/tetrapyrrole (Corrin/Porphyrin) methyltransferase [Cupriavidus taiwanensis]|uniref:16S rRNA (cytidine(1402)-2'-O)-methyltransferase n=1 Tax=Cupriavidus taiwanensis TaxID=164546 RepID=UPI000E127179|nr:16S rRNA (cytidine(1402)-2'-O)-methyltransferase [Cupriavidus taiwanensis]SOY78472.1 putative Uroporphyrin-III C/tetrapyrrole (Corrin/Porphyrin) methyltransferase [Cupriavidus taiwanensis]SOY87797.1 putative Uroporphyrin-III C/tetrapyrrole (Corrin/Porphyrin) methyltransferase [Cupriavidus taiwanensis]
MSDWISLAASQSYPAGTLYVVATPIGNVADLSLRALHVLGLADAVACEDTRNTGQLLSRVGLQRPLVAVHEHNEREAAGRIAERLAAGERIAYVSDAGTPGISDPGARLVEAVRAAGHPVVPLPGPSAAVAALSVAGDLLEAGAGRFTFAGFLPPKPKARAEAIARLAALDHAWVCYEAPHRIADTLAALAAGLPGERRLLVGRELTKLFEDIAVMPVAQAPAWLAADPNRAKGEFVLVVEGAGSAAADALPDAEAQRVLALLLAELPAKRAAKLAAAITGADTGALYQMALAQRAGDAND